MQDARDFWQRKHRMNLDAPWLGDHTAFAEETALRGEPPGPLLDLGCGRGFDSCFFADAGYEVTAMDFAAVVFEHFHRPRVAQPPRQVLHSMDDFPYPFPDRSFNVVYSRLSLHYFDMATTVRAVKEIHRILGDGGILAVMVNSVSDPELSQGTEVEPDFVELGQGNRKRFLSRASLHDLTKDLFVPYLLEQSGLNRKDPADAFVRLIASRR